MQVLVYRFTTTSDTEIILCAYMHFGKDFVEKLNGIFAFAIWDDTTRELLLYRDRAGTKPLFYTQTGSSFVFGSDPRHYFVIRNLAFPVIKSLTTYWSILWDVRWAIRFLSLP